MFDRDHTKAGCKKEQRSFTVVPRAAVENDLDGRLPVFEAGPYLFACDGVALLLVELWRRKVGPGDRPMKGEMR